MPDERRFDILSPEFHASPFSTLDRMRTEGPVVRLRLPIVGRTWLATSHESCAELLKSSQDFARDPAKAGSRTQERILKVLPRTLGLLASNMLGHDDPEHRRLRALVDDAFQTRTIAVLKPTIVETADRLLDKLDGKPEADLMAEFCRDLPLSVICAMLGLPEKDHDRFKNWLGGLKDTASVFAVIRAIPGVISVVRYLRRVSRPGGGARPEGLIAALREAEIERPDAQRGRNRLHDLPALRCGTGNHHASDIGRSLRAAHQWGPTEPVAPRLGPDADMHRGMSSLRLTCADDQAPFRDPRFDLARTSIPARRDVCGIPCRSELRPGKVRAAPHVRHYAPPKSAPFVRHRCALLPRLPARACRGVDRNSAHLGSLSQLTACPCVRRHQVAQAARHPRAGAIAGATSGLRVALLGSEDLGHRLLSALAASLDHRRMLRMCQAMVAA
ncbi:hypothetical protein ACVW0J_010175 [Bradyrhizobium sp. i1.7.7]